MNENKDLYFTLVVKLGESMDYSYYLLTLHDFAIQPVVPKNIIILSKEKDELFNDWLQSESNKPYEIAPHAFITPGTSYAEINKIEGRQYKGDISKQRLGKPALSHT